MVARDRASHKTRAIVILLTSGQTCPERPYSRAGAPVSPTTIARVSSPPVEDRPTGVLLRIAALVVALECLGLVVMGVVELFSIDSSRLQEGVTTAIFFFVYAAGLGIAAWGIAGVHSWARSPLVLTQLIGLGIAWSFLGGTTTWLSAVLAVCALFVLVVVLTPASTRALYGER